MFVLDMAYRITTRIDNCTKNVRFDTCKTGDFFFFFFYDCVIVWYRLACVCKCVTFTSCYGDVMCGWLVAKRPMVSSVPPSSLHWWGLNRIIFICQSERVSPFIFSTRASRSMSLKVVVVVGGVVVLLVGTH